MFYVCVNSGVNSCVMFYWLEWIYSFIHEQGFKKAVTFGFVLFLRCEKNNEFKKRNGNRIQLYRVIRVIKLDYMLCIKLNKELQKSKERINEFMFFMGVSFS